MFTRSVSQQNAYSRPSTLAKLTQSLSSLSRRFLKNGGNVFDGALSALLCLSFTQMQSMGLLGGFLMTVYQRSEGKAFVIDAQMTSPGKFQLPVENLTDVKRGPLAVAVPGYLKGIWEIHKKYGSIPWRQLVEPTLELCQDGIVMTKHFHDSMNVNKAIFNDPYLNSLLVDGETKTFKRPGSKLNFKKNCQFLDLLANQTEPEIFSGAIGEIIAKDFEDAGSIVRVFDLQEYKVKTSEPLKYLMSDELTLLVPDTAAVLVPSVLNILRGYQLGGSSLDDVENINETIKAHHRIIESFKHAFASRSKLGDPEFVDVKKVVDKILSTEWAEYVRSQIDDSQVQDFRKYSSKFVSPEDHGTSALSIIAENGDSISATSSINY